VLLLTIFALTNRRSGEGFAINRAASATSEPLAGDDITALKVIQSLNA